MKRALIAVAAAATGVFLWLAVRTIDLELTWRALRESDAAWIVPSVALLALSVPLRALRWWVVSAPGRRPPLREATLALLVGLFFNSILSLRAGEAARLVYLARWTSLSRAEILATIAVERVFAVLALVHRAGDRPLRLLLWPLRWLPFVAPERWEWAPRNLAHGLAALRSARVAAAGAGLTVVSWLVLAASMWALMPAFGLGLGYAAGLLVAVAVGLAMIVPAPPASLGVFEGAVVVALAAFDVDTSIALSYALVLHAVNFFPYLAAGLLVVPGRRAR